jgi:tetratricopeptide (TPR) repeat protein
MDDPFARQKALVSQFPRNELARFSLGKALYDAGDLLGAREHLSVALSLKPDWMVVQILLGKCDLAEGRTSEAVQAFQRALKLAQDQHHEGPQAELEDLLSELKAAG